MSGVCKRLGDGVGDEGGWAAGGRLNPPLRLLGLVMSPRSASHRPKHAQRAYEMPHYHWGEFQAYAFHVVPSIGPTVLVMNSHGQKITLEKQTS